MSGYIINPGTGAVPGGDPGEATKNMVRLLDDAGVAEATFAPVLAENRGDGRFCYIVRLGERECEVDMPGLPLERVRYVRSPDQSILDFPRLYVAGSSWVWCFATSSLRACLTDTEQES